VSDEASQDAASVLLVDDQPSNLSYLRQVLAGPAYRLFSASSGAEALQHMEEREFAVVLLDVSMPQMDGFEVATRTLGQRRGQTTPIIFVTASMEAPKWVLRAYSLGAVDFMLKPLDRHVVRGKVAVFAQLFRQRKHIEHQARLLQESERRDRELELTRMKLEHEQQYRSLAEALPNVIWTASTEGRIAYLNGRWSQETGLSQDESLGEGWLAALHPEEAATFALAWQRSLEGGVPLHLECRLRTPEGSHRWFLCRALPERSPEGKPLRWIGSFTDVHDQRLAHEQSRSAIRLRDEFLAIASHELRTPLTSLRLQVDSLSTSFAHQDGPGDPRESKVAAVCRHVHRLSGLIDNLLDVSRISVGQLAIDRQRFDLVEASREVTDRFIECAQQVGSSLRFEGRGPIVGSVDRMRFEQVLTNLISNAIKYGAGQPIEVVVAAEGPAVRLSVRDGGIGIESEHLGRIFGRFERAAPVQNYAGLGLGLYVAREIMTAHGGSLEVRSQPGAGAVFTATFPTLAETAELDPAGALGLPGDPAWLAANGRSQKVAGFPRKLGPG
jgi:PAS domain S-box-containing protein